MTVPLRLKNFAGDWLLSRRIADRDAGEMTLQGKVSFSAIENGLMYQEEGLLEIPGQKPMQSRQTYIWQPADGAVDVFFSDMRPFHSFALEKNHIRSDHFCDPDQYDVSYELADFPDWSSTWTVKGPRKDYVMTSWYSRPD